MKINEKNIQNLQESLILLWQWTMRINALPNALGNALFPGGGITPFSPPLNTRLYIYIYIYILYVL